MNEFLKPFLTAQKPTITYNTSNNLAWGNPTTGGYYMLGNTGVDPNSLAGYSSVVTFNEKMFNNSSQLFVAAAIVHETIHGYINYSIADAKYSIDYSNNNWMAEINGFYLIKDLPLNYSNHTVMLTDYFDKAVSVLENWSNQQATPYTKKELAMAMMFGLDTVDPGTPQNLINNINATFVAIKTKYGVTAAELDAFNRTNLNSTNKLPTTGCN